MTRNHLLPCLFSISCFLVGAVAREAVVGGRVVVHVSTFPHQVSVQIQRHIHVCGGGIIGARFILTAAHCILNRARRLRSTDLSVLAGTLNLNRTGPPAVRIRVERVFFAREFHPTIEFSHGDIAVLRLVNSLPLHQGRLSMLHLPRNYEVGGYASIAGFGQETYRESNVVDANSCLRFTTAEIFSNDECKGHYPRGAIQSDIHVCANMYTPLEYYFSPEKPYGVCTGDDGSSLFDGNTVIGILSNIPPDCDERHKPGIYTRVMHYLIPILNVMHSGRDPNMVSRHT